MPTATLGGGLGITPVQNVWYTVLDTTRNARIKTIYIQHLNDEVANKTIVFALTIDGVVRGTATTVIPGWSCLYIHPFNETGFYVTWMGPVGVMYRNIAEYNDVFGKSVKFEIRTTSALGTNPLLFASVQYEKLVAI